MEALIQLARRLWVARPCHCVECAGGTSSGRSKIRCACPKEPTKLRLREASAKRKGENHARSQRSDADHRTDGRRPIGSRLDRFNHSLIERKSLKSICRMTIRAIRNLPSIETPQTGRFGQGV